MQGVGVGWIEEMKGYSIKGPGYRLNQEKSGRVCKLNKCYMYEIERFSSIFELSML